METAELGTCQDLVRSLRELQLIDSASLDRELAAFAQSHSDGQPADLVEHLVNQAALTRFQADRILEGKGQNLALGEFVLSDYVGPGSLGDDLQAVSKTDRQPFAVRLLPTYRKWNLQSAQALIPAFAKTKHAAIVPLVHAG